MNKKPHPAVAFLLAAVAIGATSSPGDAAAAGQDAVPWPEIDATCKPWAYNCWLFDSGLLGPVRLREQTARLNE